MIKTEEQLNNDNYKINENKNINIKNKKKDNKNKVKGKDVDLNIKINKLKDENDKLKKSNENLAENNMELNKIISELKKELKLNEAKYQEEFENNRNYFEKKLSEQNEIIEKLNNNNINNNYNINNAENMKEKNNIKYNNSINNNENNDVQNISSSFDMNKYLINEEQYRQLLEENERLHKRLRKLLSIEDGDINKYSNSFQDNINFDNIDNNQDVNTNYIIEENKLLKQKIKSLNIELNKVTSENNQKVLKLQEKINQKESKTIENLNKEDIIKNNYQNKNEEKQEQELDKLLNEILLININPDDEESQKMISTLQNIKNNNKKRISQCLIINNKLKLLVEENNLLHNQLLSLQKGSTNSKDNNLNLKMNNTDYNCFCKSQNNESYDYLINALKIKDEIILKYKEKNDDSEYKYKQLMIENSKLKENNKNRNRINEYNYIQNNIKKNSLRAERAEGLEDYLLDKIVNNQKEVLGERAPRFDENNNFMSKSFQEKNDRINKKYKNYHYRERSTNDYE